MQQNNNQINERNLRNRALANYLLVATLAGAMAICAGMWMRTEMMHEDAMNHEKINQIDKVRQSYEQQQKQLKSIVKNIKQHNK